MMHSSRSDDSSKNNGGMVCMVSGARDLTTLPCHDSTNKCNTASIDDMSRLEECNEDYGFFDDFEDLQGKECNVYSGMCDESGDTSSRLAPQRPQEDSSSNDSLTIVCEIHDNKAPVSCRSFESAFSASSTSAAQLSVEGFRIVQDEYGEEAEYKVKFIVDGKTLEAWKRYKQFEALGNACVEYSELGSCSLNKSASSWCRVEKHRPWMFKNLQMNFLLKESQLLENFMKNVLFETPSVGIILEFMQ